MYLYMCIYMIFIYLFICICIYECRNVRIYVFTYVLKLNLLGLLVKISVELTASDRSPPPILAPCLRGEAKGGGSYWKLPGWWHRLLPERLGFQNENRVDT